MKVAVTGAAGYIGGQTVLKLQEAGHEVYACDTTRASPVLNQAARTWVIGDMAGSDWLHCLTQNQMDALIHCGGTSLVGPSVVDPEIYYRNNFVKTKSLVDHLHKHSPQTRIIFSSSASVYGDPVMTPCQEIDPIMPISPYGESKAMIEWLLNSYHNAYQTPYVAFRYFNACGADSKNRHGQASGATHIIARVLESVRDHKEFTIYGDKYPTRDGTCVRDYVHVEDIAQAHVMAAENLIPQGVYNLGSNKGYSNRDIVNMAEHVTKQQVKLVMGTARPGDPAELVAHVEKVSSVSDWKPQYSIIDMIQHAWAWYNR